MNTANACCAAPTTIPLWTPPHRRWLAALEPLTDRLHDVLAAAARRRAERRAAQRLASARLALLAQLDAHTLRDIGLGDASVGTRAPGAATWRDDLGAYRL